MHYFVTGATGHIGIAVASAFARAGHEVIVFDRVNVLMAEPQRKELVFSVTRDGKGNGEKVRVALPLDERAGCLFKAFRDRQMLLIEAVPDVTAAKVMEVAQVPVIGIGAGPHCGGQVLVFHDVLGLLPGPSPKFVRHYAEGFEYLRSSLAEWAEDVRGGGFPGERESYTLPEAVRPALTQWHP